MGTMLGTIKGFVDNFAGVISDVLDTEVIITDSSMNIVGSSFRYFSLYNHIQYGSLIATVLMNNQNLLIDEKASIQSCRECEKYKECKMRGFIGVPIRYGNQILGVIALVLPRFKVKTLFENISSTVFFMERMAELVAARIQNHIEKKGLKQKIMQIESILDLMEDAVLYTDVYGNIIYLNQTFRDIFGIKEDYIGVNAARIYPELEEWYRKGKGIDNEKVSINYDSGSFYGIINSKRVWLNEQEYGIILSFRPYRNIQDTSKLFSIGTLVTFRWLKQFLGEEMIEKAKRYAKIDENILISGEDNVLNEMLGKAIFNQSPRRLEDLKLVYAQNSYRELLVYYLLDENGLLRGLNRGTILIVQPEYLALYVQEKLAEFIKTGRITLKGRYSIHTNVRFIFCTTANLAELSKDGRFNQDLYYLISKNEIKNTETLYNDFAIFSRYIQTGLKYYCHLYEKNELKLSSEHLKGLWRKYRDCTVTDIEFMLERIASRRYKEELWKKELTEEEHCSLEELEKIQLKRMLADGYSKKEIANILKISRTTLYRKLKSYQLE